MSLKKSIKTFSRRRCAAKPAEFKFVMLRMLYSQLHLFVVVNWHRRRRGLRMRLAAKHC